MYSIAKPVFLSMQIVLSSEDGIVISITGLGNYNITRRYKIWRKNDKEIFESSARLSDSNRDDLVAGFPAAASRYATSISSMAVVK